MFLNRHIGPSESVREEMLKNLGYDSLDSFISDVVPPQIRRKAALTLKDFPQALSENDATARLRTIAEKNKLFRSYIGMGYYGCLVPTVIQRTIFENPDWYTSYTPYQPEISQGRLEALLNYQTLVCELTGLDVSNASLLDEGTAAAEAMAMARGVAEQKGLPTEHFAISERCHPQTVSVVEVRAKALGVTTTKFAGDAVPEGVFGALISYPDTLGEIRDLRAVTNSVHAKGGVVIAVTDLLALTLIEPPGAWGADIAVGNSQRFGVPLGFGGPHAGFMAVKDEFKRLMPGRLIGVSEDAQGNKALRLSLQTREQHIRREKATSNICTAQVLLAVMASMYAVYHGPKGLRAIALSVHGKAESLATTLRGEGVTVSNAVYFDTVAFTLSKELAAGIEKRSLEKQINIRRVSAESFTISTDETTSVKDLSDLFYVVTGKSAAVPLVVPSSNLPLRKGEYLTHEVFNRYHSETEFLRYVKRLEAKDFSLSNGMIPLGSCTMKLNAASEMYPVTWKEFGNIHPFAPLSQSEGYRDMISQVERALCDITGFAAASLQPNAGSQGEYAGLLAIRAYLESKGQGARTVCLIPKSAHGTNPASAVMAGMEVVVVDCDASGNIDLTDLAKKADAHSDKLAAVMVTYPSTHGVFEERIKEISEIIHSRGGQVYMDGANLNAHVGLTSPELIGADVCHINLHKTFCIPHGGGGPGVGPIAVRAHLAPFLPSHPVVEMGQGSIGPISAASWGSASILPIPWMYIAMMGSEGLTLATQVAILSANYIAKRLDPHYPVLYKGSKGLVAHECIIDLRPLKKNSGIEAEDIAKRLMDYGFHAPTVSFPVAGTLMIEPTESESREELDRFCDAMIQIRKEIADIESGVSDPKSNPLKGAPHTAAVVISSSWDRAYSREVAAFPSVSSREAKFWPSVGRVDGVYGDRNLVCTCAPIDSYQK